MWIGRRKEAVSPDMECEVEQRGLPGLAVIGLGEERQLSEAPMIMFRDWQVNLNSIFGEGLGQRPQMDDWFCISQEPIAARRTRARTSQTAAGDLKSASVRRASVIPVSLRPEDFPCSRLRPRSRLKMNSLCSALTAVLVGLTDPEIRAKGNGEVLFPAQHSTAPTPGAGESPFPFDRDLSWMPNNVHREDGK
jgi:hypothetical protein